jgi:hypothetical protein
MPEPRRDSVVRHALRTPHFAVRLEVGPEPLAEILLPKVTVRSGWTIPLPAVRFEAEPEVLDEELSAGQQGVAIPVSVVCYAVELELGPVEGALAVLDAAAAFVAPAQS